MFRYIFYTKVYFKCKNACTGLKSKSNGSGAFSVKTILHLKSTPSPRAERTVRPFCTIFSSEDRFVLFFRPEFSLSKFFSPPKPREPHGSPAVKNFFANAKKLNGVPSGPPWPAIKNRRLSTPRLKQIATTPIFTEK